MEMKALKRRPRHTYTDDKMVNCDLAGIAYKRAHAHSQFVPSTTTHSTCTKALPLPCAHTEEPARTHTQ